MAGAAPLTAYALALAAVAWALWAWIRLRMVTRRNHPGAGAQGQTVAELESALASYRAVAENSPDLISRFDRNHKRLYANTVVESVLGKPRGKIVGMGLTRPEMPPLPPGALVELVANIDRVFAEKVPASMQVQGPSPRGLREFYTRIVPEFDDKGEVATVLVVSCDVTDLGMAPRVPPQTDGEKK